MAIIHQTLHGYIDGHTLICSSLEIPVEIKRIMLPMSDMSGNNMVKGYEEYYTGYPLSDINCYAISKTWYAPEMRRPGCVWTQTLLIAAADLPTVNDISALLQLFIRPTSPGEYDIYKKPITWNRERTSSAIEYFSGSFSPSLVKNIILKLYGSESDLPVLLTSYSTEYFEQIFFGLWFQQWPRLQRSFTFCTGSISPRTFNGKHFDLQVTLPSNNLGNNEVVNVDNISDPGPNPTSFPLWVESTFQDLFYPSSFRKFAFKYGADVSGMRKYFQPLFEIYLMSKENFVSVTNYIDFISHFFPSPDEAGTLKVNMLSPLKSGSEHRPSFTEKEILYELATTPHFNSFNYTRLEFSARFLHFVNLYERDAEILLNDIIEKEPNKFGEEVIRLLSAEIESSLTNKPLWLNTKLTMVFASLTPSITYNIDFWNKNLDFQVEILDSLKRNPSATNIDWRKIITNLIELNSPINVNLLSFKTISIEEIIMDWIDKNGRNSIGRNWTDYLQNNLGGVLTWLSKNSNATQSTLEVAIETLDPNSNKVIGFGLEVWANILLCDHSYFNKYFRQNFKAFALAAAFNLSNSNSLSIFKQCFEEVYLALAAEALPYRYWSYLEVHTKPLSFWKDWDKCKKLLNACIDKCKDNAWNTNEFANDFFDNDLRQRFYIQVRKRS